VGTERIADHQMLTAVRAGRSREPDRDGRDLLVALPVRACLDREEADWRRPRVTLGLHVEQNCAERAYIAALTGQPPSTALNAQVTPSRRVALKTPYRNAVTALEAGHYTLTVSDRSPRASFHLVGPGLNLHTTRHFTGTKTWAFDLRHGNYRYGPGRGQASLAHQFSVLATQAPEIDLALGRPATASRSDPGSPPSEAVDGLYDTSWNAGDFAPQWIQIDLGTAQTIGRIRLIVAQNPPGYTDHRIWVRGPNTGDPERLACQLTGNTADPQSLICQPPNPITDVRYVRVETLTSPSWVAWREIEIYAR
jgi:hypothetical protein